LLPALGCIIDKELLHLFAEKLATVLGGFPEGHLSQMKFLGHFILTTRRRLIGGNN